MVMIIFPACVVVSAHSSDSFVGGARASCYSVGSSSEPQSAFLFLASAAIGKPLIYQLARARIKRRSPAQIASFEAMWNRPAFSARDDDHDARLGDEPGRRGRDLLPSDLRSHSPVIPIGEPDHGLFVIRRFRKDHP
jgi:hypothetical protein